MARLSMRKQILLVEDSLDALAGLMDLISMEGYEVITALNGVEALDKLYVYHPDLVITDLRMPKMDGYKLIENIKKKNEFKSCPIIVFSANATPDDERRCVELGADLFLKKPCPTELLLDYIKSLSDTSRH